jgi:DNA modification methylase
MNQLYFGDCLDVLKELNKKQPEGFIDLVYIDPPFNSKRNYNILFEDVDLSDTKAQREAFSDTWSSVSHNDTLEEIHNLDLDLFKFLKALDEIRLSKSVIPDTFWICY